MFVVATIMVPIKFDFSQGSVLDDKDPKRAVVVAKMPLHLIQYGWVELEPLRDVHRILRHLLLLICDERRLACKGPEL